MITLDNWVTRVGADPRVCPNKKVSLRSKSFKNLIQNLSKIING